MREINCNNASKDEINIKLLTFGIILRLSTHYHSIKLRFFVSTISLFILPYCFPNFDLLLIN